MPVFLKHNGLDTFEATYAWSWVAIQISTCPTGNLCWNITWQFVAMWIARQVSPENYVSSNTSTNLCIIWCICARIKSSQNWDILITLQWRRNGRDCVSNHQRLDCLLNRLSRHRSKKTSKLRFTGLCEGNPPGTGGFLSQWASNAENVFIWWRHHELTTGALRLLPWPTPTENW